MGRYSQTYRGTRSGHFLYIIRQINIMLSDPGFRSPAIQLPFLIRYPRSVEAANIDKTYATLPNIANTKRAGDSPSHLVLKFLAVNGTIRSCMRSYHTAKLADLRHARSH